MDLQQINILITQNWLNTLKFTSKGNIEHHAAIIGVSPNDLRNYCQEVLHKPFKVFLTDLRLEYGLRLMFTHGISTNAAATLAGIEDDSNFRRMYLERYGVYPSQDLAIMKEYLAIDQTKQTILDKIIKKIYGHLSQKTINKFDLIDIYLKKAGREIQFDKERFPLLNIQDFCNEA